MELDETEEGRIPWFLEEECRSPEARMPDGPRLGSRCYTGAERAGGVCYFEVVGCVKHQALLAGEVTIQISPTWAASNKNQALFRGILSASFARVCILVSEVSWVNNLLGCNGSRGEELAPAFLDWTVSYVCA